MDIRFCRIKEAFSVVVEESGAFRANPVCVKTQTERQVYQLIPGTFSITPERATGTYSLSGFRPFTATIPRVAGRDDIFPYLLKMALSFVALEADGLTQEDVLFRKENVYIFLDNGTIRYLGLPFKAGEGNSLNAMMVDILDVVEWNPQECTDYVSELRAVLDTNPAPRALADAIRAIMEKPVRPAGSEEGEPDDLALFAEAAQELVAGLMDETEEQSGGSDEDDVPNAPENTTAVTAAEAAPEPVNDSAAPEAMEPVSVSAAPEDDSGDAPTVSLLVEEKEPERPHLIRMRTGESIRVDADSFFIGKDALRANYAITDNGAVSRVHAVIERRGKEYYIVDCNSTNHVFVNGWMLPINGEACLENGTRFRLGNEDFDFYTERQDVVG